MEYIDQQFTEERALFGRQDLVINGCVFERGESPAKECRNLTVTESLFRYKYPFWYCRNISLDRVTFFEMARAGIWYTDHLAMSNSIIEGPKNFRRCNDISLTNVLFSNALETLWNCSSVRLTDVKAKGPYFAMNCRDVTVDGLDLIGDYSFDGAVNVVVNNSHLASKDAFWNTENVVVRNSFITGEYLGWNGKNLTLEDCTIESLQGMCYVDNLVMKNCRLINTTLAFEYSDVQADIRGTVDSVFNPGKGCIKADKISHLVIQKDRIDPSLTKIICNDIGETLDSPDTLW